MKFCLVFLCFLSCSAGRLRAPTADDEIQKLKEEVTGNKAFQEKVQGTCEKAKDEDKCKTDATHALFCQLLQRSKPELAKQTDCLVQSSSLVQAAAPAGSFAAIKAKIQNSP